MRPIISTPKIHEGYYAAARTLLDKGVKFVAASGRQYPALARLFDPVHEELLYSVLLYFYYTTIHCILPTIFS